MIIEAKSGGSLVCIVAWEWLLFSAAMIQCKLAAKCYNFDS